ncbi:LysE family translocator [Sphaerotilus mobilis]|uniref:Threonine/homoserine/homoserine lactone efflux protein n=1 Tax=Sphaerotilus mobilis TaxID=47994 RepID=A0A4Q7LME2_9BURK|nr:LysE family translocator [Sphaerotilus mobilis]RZS54769.1 threonine/homoserine/homoserine lactone efflux protein [Sphaerotilus mobilis]
MTPLGLQDLALFSLTVLVLNATPGVDLLFTITRTLKHGVRGGLAGAAGISAGCVVHAVGAAFGLAALLATSAAAFAVLKWAGAAYLLWLGFSAWRAACRQAVDPAPVDAASAGASTSVAAESPAAIFRQGLLTNVLNPKVAIFFLALLPQFIAAEAPHKTWAFLALGAWFVLQSAVFLIALVLAVAPLRRWRPGALLRRALDGLTGLLFLGLAARLALTTRP